MEWRKWSLSGEIDFLRSELESGLESHSWLSSPDLKTDNLARLLIALVLSVFILSIIVCPANASQISIRDLASA